MDYIAAIDFKLGEVLLAAAAGGAVAAALAALFVYGRRVRVPLPRPAAVVWLAAALYFVVFSAATLGRHFSMATSGLDLGYYGNAIWQFGHGHFFRQTLVPTNWFMQPCSPLLAVLGPLTYIFPGPAYLLVLQSALLASGIVLIFAVARPAAGSAWPAAALALSFAFAPALHGANLFDFHPRALGVPLALGAFYFFSRGRFRAGLICAVLVALAREELALHAVGLAVYGGVAAGRRRAGFIAAAVLALYFLFTVTLYPKLTYAPDAMPWQNWYATWHLKYFRPGPEHEAPSAAILQFKAGYFAVLLAPVAALVPAAGPALITIITPLAVPAFSSLKQSFTLGLQYPLSALPFLYGAAALGLRRAVTAAPSRRRRFWFAGGALAAVAVQIAFFALFYDRYYFWNFGAAFPDAHDKALAGACARVPGDVPLCVDDPFAAHLAHRRNMYLYSYIWQQNLPEPPRAMVLNRRLHYFREFTDIMVCALGWKLGLEKITNDYAYFAPGRGRYPPMQLIRSWFNNLEEWQGSAPLGGKVVADPRAHDGRAMLVRRQWIYETQPHDAFFAGVYDFALRLRPAAAGDRVTVVADVNPAYKPDAPRRYVMVKKMKSGEYANYVLHVESADDFKLRLDVSADAPFYYDTAFIATDAYERHWGEKMVVLESLPGTFKARRGPGEAEPAAE